MIEDGIYIVEAQQPVARVILAHGAGAGSTSEFMQLLSEQIAQQNIEVVLFDFPYMQTIQATGKRRPPDKFNVLCAHFGAVIDTVTDARPALPTFIGGKSMGGRVATHFLSNDVDSSQYATAAGEVKGGVVFGYPFHPPGKPDKLRVEHLRSLHSPLLILQGQRDTFGNQHEIQGYSLCEQTQIQFLADGDHSFKPRKASGFSQPQHIATAASEVAEFIRVHLHGMSN